MIRRRTRFRPGGPLALGLLELPLPAVVLELSTKAATEDLSMSS